MWKSVENGRVKQHSDVLWQEENDRRVRRVLAAAKKSLRARMTRRENGGANTMFPFSRNANADREPFHDSLPFFQFRVENIQKRDNVWSMREEWNFSFNFVTESLLCSLCSSFLPFFLSFFFVPLLLRFIPSEFLVSPRYDLILCVSFFASCESISFFFFFMFSCFFFFSKKLGRC